MDNGISEKERDDTSVVFPLIAILAGTLTLHLTSRFAPLIPLTPLVMVEGFLFSYILSNYENQNILFQIIKTSSDSWADVNGELLLFIFLPALLFGETMALDYHIFERCFWQCAFLAGGGVLVGSVMLAVSAYLFLPFNWSFSFCMVFGSILSATDTVAVLMQLKELGASPLLTMKVAGEAMMNDGTSIILFKMFWNLYTLNHMTLNTTLWFDMMMDVLRVTIGGPIIGMVVGFFAFQWMGLVTRRHSQVDITIQLAITILTAYASYFIGDHLLHVSGVLCCCSAALVLAKYVKPLFCSLETHQNVWEAIDYFGNVVLFFLAGVITERAYSSSIDGADDDRHFKFQNHHFIELVAFFILSSVIRLLFVMLFYPLLQLIGPKFEFKESIFIGWAGLRGTVGVVLSLYVLQSGHDFLAGKQLLFMISGLSVVSLLVQGITIEPLLKCLCLTNGSVGPSQRASLECIYRRARLHGLETFKKACFKANCDPYEVHRYLTSLRADPIQTRQQNKRWLASCFFPRDHHYDKVKDSNFDDGQDGGRDQDYEDEVLNGYPDSEVIIQEERHAPISEDKVEIRCSLNDVSLGDGDSEAGDSVKSSSTKYGDFTVRSLQRRLRSFNDDDRSNTDLEETTQLESVLRGMLYRLVKVGYWEMIRKGKLSRSSPATLILLSSVDFALDMPHREVCDIDYIVATLESSWSSLCSNYFDQVLSWLGNWSSFSLEVLYRRNFASCEVMLYICEGYEQSHAKAQKLLRNFSPPGRAETSICLESAVNIQRFRNVGERIHQDMIGLIKTNIVANHILVKEFEYVYYLINRGVVSYKDSQVLVHSIHKDLQILRNIRQQKAHDLAKLQVRVDLGRSSPSTLRRMFPQEMSTRRYQRSNGEGGFLRSSLSETTLLNIALDGSLKARYGSTQGDRGLSHLWKDGDGDSDEKEFGDLTKGMIRSKSMPVMKFSGQENGVGSPPAAGLPEDMEEMIGFQIDDDEDDVEQGMRQSSFSYVLSELQQFNRT